MPLPGTRVLRMKPLIRYESVSLKNISAQAKPMSGVRTKFMATAARSSLGLLRARPMASTRRLIIIG